MSDYIVLNPNSPTPISQGSDIDPKIFELAKSAGIQSVLDEVPGRREAFIEGIKKFGLNEADLTLVNKFMNDPNSLEDDEKRFMLNALENAKKGKPKTKMQYEKLIQDIYSSGFWDRVEKHAKYDFKSKILRDKLLNEDPEPNIILISGMSSDLGEINSDSVAPNMLDLPFSTCIIEATDRTLFNLPEPIRGDASAMAIVELGDGYGFVAITERGEHVWAVDPTKNNYTLCMTVAQDICRFINSKKVAVGQSNTRLKFKHKKAGNQYIKKIVHISSKVKDSPVERRYTDVEWSHRWEVRGHRRSIGPGKVGKDRNGNPTWIGYTWVRPHVKGPDDKDIIKKVRIKQYVSDELH